MAALAVTFTVVFGLAAAPPARGARGVGATTDDGAVTDPRCGPSFELRVPILMYHRVIPREAARHSQPALVVEPHLFAAHTSALAKAGWQTITLRALGSDLANCVRPPPRTVVITFDDGYRDGYTYAFPSLRAHGFVATYFVISARVDQSKYLTSSELVDMSAFGMEIADHTVHHVGMWALPEALVEEEIDVAADAIEALVGTRPATFAYPFGNDTPSAIRVARAAGFAIAVTNRQGVSEKWATRLTTPRLRVNPFTTPEKLLQILAPYR